MVSPSWGSLTASVAAMIAQAEARQRTEAAEERLCPHAARSRRSRGRLVSEEACPLRTCFQRDRDRIIHSKAFRRLKHKTQVFIAPLGDHYVTRLTHTLEVAQIARTLARALELNEDLAEAIALGHDLGHTPFGHVGEDVLNELHPDGFRHNEQSLRVVDVLEKEGRGLNLSWEVRDGILNHAKGQAQILGEGWGDVGTLEGQVCKIADVVAYVNHDLEDAVRAGLITRLSFPRLATSTLGHNHSERINTLVLDIVGCSRDSIRGGEHSSPGIRMSPQVVSAITCLREFLFATVYKPSLATSETAMARRTLRRLYSHFQQHEELLPSELSVPAATRERRVTDYIAGMTDQYALRLAQEIPV